MYGKSHMLIGVVTGTLIEQAIHVTGAPLTGRAAHAAFLSTLALNKVTYVLALALGSLLPDIDVQSSLFGRSLGCLSVFLQRTFGHRNFFHSLWGLFIGTILGMGIICGGYQVLRWGVLLGIRSFSSILPMSLAQQQVEHLPPPHLLVILLGVGIGYALHLLADACTRGGIALLWPNPRRYGVLARRHRLRVGEWREWVLDALLLAVFALCWQRGWIIF
jgi:membrane-bound metal-dependent hydrolase YbcI (DUF457 family)